MSWSFNNAPAASAGAGGRGEAVAAAQAGADLDEVYTDQLALDDMAAKTGEFLKVSDPWNPLPPPFASLLSVASGKGLVAAAGQNALVVANTQTARRDYIVKSKASATKCKPINAIATIHVPRLSHVVFSSDESCLVVASEQGGGLAVYDTKALASGKQESAFQIPTQGVSVRHLIQNPNSAPDFAHMFGVVLTNGQLVLADLKNRQLVDGAKGKVFAEKVLSAAWSKMGKQIVVGLEDSTCAQIDPQGNVKDQIPAPPQLQDIRREDYDTAKAMPVTSIFWLQTHQFLIIYTPFNGPPANEDDLPPREDSVYFIAERANKTSPFIFKRFGADPTPAFTQEKRTPANHFLQRLGGWDPALADSLIISSSASIETGVFAHFMSGGGFAPLCISEESRKANMPLSLVNDTSDTTPIGMAIDMSATELAPKPVPSIADSMENSTHPLPCLYLLSTDGLLSMYWVVYAEGVKQQKPHGAIVNRTGDFRNYRQLAETADGGRYETVNGKTYDLEDREQRAEYEEAVKKAPAETSKPTPAPAASGFGQASQLGGTSGSGFGKPSTPGTSSPFGQPPQSGGGSAFGKPSFGQPSFGQASQSAGSTFGTPSLGQASQAGASGLAKPAAPAFAQTSGFGQASQMGGGGSGFGQVGAMGARKPDWGAPMTNGSPFTPSAAKGGVANPSPFASFAKNPSPFAKASTNPSPFANASTKSESPFAKASTNPSPFANASKTSLSLFGGSATAQSNSSSPLSSFGKASLSNETSTGSTATLGSNGTGTFGKPSNSQGSTFGTPSLSKESTGLSGISGFTLGSTFKGDGTAKDDLPKPANPGAGLFGDTFGKSLYSTDPAVKPEPGTEKQPALNDIPEAKPFSGDAPLPPDPSTFNYKKAQASMAPPPGVKEEQKKAPERATADAPLPPDPSTFNYKKAQSAMAPPPGVLSTSEEKDVPIAGSPPQDITHSRTFSPAESEDGPADDGSDDLDFSGEEEEEVDDDEDDQESHNCERDEDEESNDYEDVDDEDDSQEEEEEEEEKYVVQNPAGLANFMSRLGPKVPDDEAPKSPDAGKLKTKSTTPKSQESSYTPTGFPKGPVLHPSTQRKAADSPRSPSPQRQPPQHRSVTSPVRQQPSTGSLGLPSSIKATAVPPAKPVERSPVPPKPTEPTAGELEDQAADRVKAILAAPIQPTLEMSDFHTHQDYIIGADTPGIGGQIEKVFRDVNSMIDVIGLNARALQSFLQGQQELRKPGQRTREDLEGPKGWCLGDMDDLGRLLDDISRQLESGKLQSVQDIVCTLSHEQQEALRTKIKTAEMRRQILTHTDPTRRAEQEAAPLSAEMSAQQSELRTKVQRVQKLLSDLEQKMTMLRADLSSLPSKDGKTTTPVPTVEAVERTILKMTAMVEQNSGDIDLLESQIKRLPNGIADLRLADDYEDDLASRLGGSKLLSDSPSRRTPQNYPRMAPNGDGLGMSAMFGASRFRTPPSSSLALRGSPSATGRASVLRASTGSALRQSTGSLSGSARKKMVDVTEEEVEAYHGKVSRRRDVLGALKDRVQNGPARVQKVG